MPSRAVLPRRLLCGVLTAAALNAATADARLIPTPGPWPTTIAGATNPLVGTTFAFNGGHASANADLRVWLPFHGGRRMAITRTVGQTTVVRGRLRNRDNRRSIAGATVTLVAQNNVYEPGWSAITNTRTDRRGRFRALVPPGYHRRVAIVYYASIDAVAPVVSRRLLVRAKSRVQLARPYHRRRAYRFDGRVSAGPVALPALGLIIGLQVRNRQGNWITARLARTTASGRFRIRYTFARASRLTVRVVVPSQNGWALYAGHSRRSTIKPR